MEQLSLCRTWFLKEPWICFGPEKGEEEKEREIITRNNEGSNFVLNCKNITDMTLKKIQLWFKKNIYIKKKKTLIGLQLKL